MVRIGLLLLFSVSVAAQQNSSKIRTENNIPVDIYSAVKIMDNSFTDSEKSVFKELTKDSILTFFWNIHPGDFWYNWHIGDYSKNAITLYFNKLGLYIGYDIYKAIVISFHEYINGKSVTLQNTIADIKRFRELEHQAYLNEIANDTLVSIDKWKSFSVPTEQDVEEKRYGFDSIDWHVYKLNDKIYVNKGRGRVAVDSIEIAINHEVYKRKYLIRDHRKIVRLKDGYLAGLNQGEWGGALYWLSSDKIKAKKISNHQIVQFAINEDSIYAIEGISHLSISEGSLIKIQKENKKWTVQEYIKLPSAPLGIHIDSYGNFIVGTMSGILAINGNTVKVLVEGFWRWGLYPNSMVISDNNIYIGMRKGVYKYNISSGQQEWLMPGN